MAMPTFARLAPVVFAMVLLAAIVGRASTAPSQTPTPQPPTDFPPGANRDMVVRICKECHPVSQILRRHESRGRWSFLVDQMIKEGAEIKDDEFDKVVSYLSVAFGKKVRINEATAAVVADAFDIEDAPAEAIVKYRTEKGPFKEWKDLLKVPGVDAQRIEEQKDNLDFSVYFSSATSSR